MPDNEDYKAFFDLLARPRTWSEDERRQMEWRLAAQRRAVEDAHPKDEKGRAALRKVVEAIEAAIADADRAAPP